VTVRALIVDDSGLCRAILRDLLEEEGDIRVVGEAADGYQALAMVEQLCPDVVTMDLDMPGADGLETVAAIMSRQPVPILVVTGRSLGPGAELAFVAIEKGAIDLLPKVALARPETRAWIRAQVRTCAATPVFLHTTALPDTLRPVRELSRTVHAPPSPEARLPARLAVLVAGTGGATAVADVVGSLPRDLGCAVAVALHGPMQFAPAFAGFLGKRTALPIAVVGRIPAECTPGTVLLPQDGFHLECPSDQLLAAVADSELKDKEDPAAALFRSLADTFRSRVVVVILSGLEVTGSEALGALHDVGALTIAEDPERARRPEMPRAAIERGDVDRVVPIRGVAQALVEACRG
jgi:two-component system chemotaxis response regulator CheB